MTMFKFVATCGRGFENDVTAEIKEKIPGVASVRTLNEGKVMFSVDGCFSQSQGSLQNIYCLKMVERIMLLLYYEQFTGGETFPEIETEHSLVMKACRSVSWKEVCGPVKLLHEVSPPVCSPVACRCPSAAVGRNEEKERRESEQPNKRKKFSLSGTGSGLRDSSIIKENEEISSFECVEKLENHDTKDAYNKDDNNIIETNSSILSKTETNSISCTALEENVIDTTKILYRVSCRITGKWKLMSKCNKSPKGSKRRKKSSDEGSNSSLLLTKTTETVDAKDSKNCDPKHPASEITSKSLISKSPETECSARQFILDTLDRECPEWEVCWQRPLIDVYFNLTDCHALLGISLTRLPLSLRCSIPHICLRSTVCHLMLREAFGFTLLSSRGTTTNSESTESDSESSKGQLHNAAAFISEDQVNQNAVTFAAPTEILLKILDPMCGAGTILAECALSFEAAWLFGCDISTSQLSFATCNLSSAPVAVSLLNADAARLPFRSNSFDAVVCDLPFGKKFGLKIAGAERASCDLEEILKEMARLVKPTGRIVLLVALHMEPRLQEIVSNFDFQENSLILRRRVEVPLGRTVAAVCVLAKGVA